MNSTLKSSKKAARRGKPFKKGCDPRRSTKPGPGRPPRELCIPDILREIGKQKDPETKREKLVALCNKIYDEALNGQAWAAHFIADRMEGRPTQRIETEAAPLVVFNLPDDNWEPGGSSTNSP